MMSDRPELSDAARRGLQRAGIHLVKAAIEVVAGVSAFIEELQATGERRDDDSGDGGPERIVVE
jgi:hypothetical protein